MIDSRNGCRSRTAAACLAAAGLLVLSGAALATDQSQQRQQGRDANQAAKQDAALDQDRLPAGEQQEQRRMAPGQARHQAGRSPGKAGHQVLRWPTPAGASASPPPGGSAYGLAKRLRFSEGSYRASDVMPQLKPDPRLPLAGEHGSCVEGAESCAMENWPDSREALMVPIATRRGTVSVSSPNRFGKSASSSNLATWMEEHGLLVPHGRFSTVTARRVGGGPGRRRRAVPGAPVPPLCADRCRHRERPLTSGNAQARPSAAGAPCWGPRWAPH